MLVVSICRPVRKWRDCVYTVHGYVKVFFILLMPFISPFLPLFCTNEDERVHRAGEGGICAIFKIAIRVLCSIVVELAEMIVEEYMGIVPQLERDDFGGKF